MSRCTAPARHPRVLHRRGASSPAPFPCPATGEAATGWTACQMPMLIAERWTDLDWRPGDRLCAACFPPEPAPPSGWAQDPLI